MAENPSVSTRIPPEWKQELIEFAKVNDTTISKILHDFIGQLLNKVGVDGIDSVDEEPQPASLTLALQSSKTLVDQSLTGSTVQLEGVAIQPLTDLPDDFAEPLPLVSPEVEPEPQTLPNRV